VEELQSRLRGYEGRFDEMKDEIRVLRAEKEGAERKADRVEN